MHSERLAMAFAFFGVFILAHLCSCTYGDNLTSIDKEYGPILGFTASIRGNKGSCSGSVINERWLLTAAHCGNLLGGKVRVARTNIKRGDDEVDAYVTRVVRHPKFDLHREAHDIALVCVLPPLLLSAKVQLYAGNKLPQGTQIFSSGYGRCGPRNREEGRKVTVRKSELKDFISLKQCWMKSRPVNLDLDKYLICATSDTSQCKGDSGGPTVVQGTHPGTYVQIGVNARSCKHRKPPHHMFGTSVSSHIKWIRHVCKGNVNITDQVPIKLSES